MSDNRAKKVREIMGKRMSKTATANDFATTTATVASAAVVPVTAETPETVKPTPKDIVMTTKEAVAKHLKALDNAVKACRKGFLSIGYNLYWLKDTLAYQEVDGKEYLTIEAFAKDKYDISRSTCLAYIAVVEKFGKVNPETNEIDSLQGEYKDYSPTALITMCAMDSETLAKCKPNMRVKDLKALMTAKDEENDDNDSDIKNSSSDGDNDNDSDDTDDDSGINSDDTRVKGFCLLHINTVEELEDKKGYVFEVMKRILTQKTSVNYTVGVMQLEPPEIVK